MIALLAVVCCVTVITVASLRFVERITLDNASTRCPRLLGWVDGWKSRCELAIKHGGPHRCRLKQTNGIDTSHEHWWEDDAQT